jgi:hypothetical protein
MFWIVIVSPDNPASAGKPGVASQLASFDPH